MTIHRNHARRIEFAVPLPHQIDPTAPVIIQVDGQTTHTWRRTTAGVLITETTTRTRTVPASISYANLRAAMVFERSGDIADPPEGIELVCIDDVHPGARQPHYRAGARCCVRFYNYRQHIFEMVAATAHTGMSKQVRYEYAAQLARDAIRHAVEIYDRRRVDGDIVFNWHGFSLRYRVYAAYVDSNLKTHEPREQRDFDHEINNAATLFAEDLMQYGVEVVRIPDFVAVNNTLVRRDQLRAVLRETTRPHTSASARNPSKNDFLKIRQNHQNRRRRLDTLGACRSLRLGRSEALPGGVSTDG